MVRLTCEGALLRELRLLCTHVGDMFVNFYLFVNEPRIGLGCVETCVGRVGGCSYILKT